MYNAERFIERCVRTLFEQTYDNIQFLFVDDCTPDKSVEIIKKTIEKFPQRKPNLRIINHETNRGGAAALNTLINNCFTEWFFMVDSDDWIEKNTIELLIKKQRETGADIVSGKALRHTLKGEFELVVSNQDDKTQFVLENLGYDLHHTLWNRLIRKSLYDEGIVCAEEGTNLGEDWQVMSRLAWNARKVAHLDTVTYHYNCTNTSSYVYGKNQFNRKNFEQDYKSWEIVNDFYKDKAEIFREKLFESGEKLLYRYLYLAVEGEDKQAFTDVKKKLQRHSSLFFSHGRLDRGRIKSFVESHYYLLRLSFPVREFFVKVKS